MDGCVFIFLYDFPPTHYVRRTVEPLVVIGSTALSEPDLTDVRKPRTLPQVTGVTKQGSGDFRRFMDFYDQFLHLTS